MALVPLEVYAARIAVDSKPRFGGTMLVSATAREAELRLLLRERHRLAPGDDDDFIIGN